MAKKILYAIDYKGEYKWVERENSNRETDIFCQECKYNPDTCGFSLEYCPYRVISQREYFKRRNNGG